MKILPLNWLAAIMLIAGLVTAGCRTLFEPKMSAASALENKEYITASRLLTEEYNAEKNVLKQSELAYKIAECYRMANRTKDAEKWYKSAMEYGTNTELPFKYALMLKSNGKYNEAMQLFKEYALGNPNNRAKATRQIQSCRQALEWQQNPTRHKVFSVSSLNSPASDFAPVIYHNQLLVFTSSRSGATGNKLYGWTGEKHSDLFVAERKEGFVFSNLTLFGDSINTPYNEGTAAFSPDFKEIFFTACGSPNKKDDYCKIYASYLTDKGKWSIPELVPLFDVDTINVGQPFLSADGMELYFSADNPNGFGDKDLYRVTKGKDGFWSDPENLGPEINTEYYEGFPYIGPDGKLYFASSGHAGMGGLDIFAATRKGNKWVNPQNLRYPINSAADDFALVFEPYVKPELLDSLEATGFFSSSREGGMGNDDIYAFILETPKEIPDSLIAQKPPAETKKPDVVYVLQAQVVQKNFSTPDDPNSAVAGKTPVPDAIAEILGLSVDSRISSRLITNAKGNFSLELEPATDYKITAFKNGYFKQSVEVTTKNLLPPAGKDTVYVFAEIMIDKIYRQKEIVLENIYYDLDKYDIRPDAMPTLNKLAQLLKENPNIKILLGSHTDSRGSDRYNETLSQNRAQAAVNYLAQQGIDARRLLAKGYGENRLVNECANGVTCTEEQHQQNRRTTFQVIAENFSAPDVEF
ncbi:MAG TPA: OmpA family protein [Chitinophagales bacterium]|nr:OmpA family protein [Chitinophagales bacterium]